MSHYSVYICSIVGKKPKISNRIQSGESRGAVEYINVSSVLSSGQFCGKSLRDPGHGVSGHVFDGTRKDKETLRV